MEKFTEEQKELVNKIFENRKGPTLIMPKNDTLLLRSVAVYRNHFNGFAQFCKDNKMNQTAAIFMAIEMFMSTFNEK